MARILSEKDIEILNKLAPECKGLLCIGSGAAYRSILPPLANHYSEDAEDFGRRLEKASEEDLEYIGELVLAGEESLGCVPSEYVTIFLKRMAEKLGEDRTTAIRKLYEKNKECF